MNATLYPFSLGLTPPLQTGDDRITRREGFVLRLSTGSHTGFGEAAPLPGWTESFRDCEIALDQATERLVDGDVTEARSVCTNRPAARHAVDQAILDLKSRRVGVPLFQYLGGGSDVDCVPVNATIGVSGTEETMATAKEAVQAGFDCLKLKVGNHDPTQDARRVKAVHDAIPADVSVRIDANGAWTESTATSFLDTLGPVPLEYLEQPLPPTDITGHANLRDQDIPIALDESVPATEIESLIEADAADVFILKPMAIGGIERTRSMATTATDAGLDVVISTTMDAAISRIGATHLAGSLTNPRPAGLATGSRFDTDLVTNTPTIDNGYAHLPEGNGNGVTPDTTDDD